jgi:hypothetical protein
MIKGQAYKKEFDIQPLTAGFSYRTSKLHCFVRDARLDY